jgi:small subunit ribosomal protein S13
MVRILGIDLSRDKRIKYSLTAIYGIGLSRAEEILKKAELSDTNENIIRTKDLSDIDVSKIRKILEEDYELEGDLRRLNSLSIKRKAFLTIWRPKVPVPPITSTF